MKKLMVFLLALALAFAASAKQVMLCYCLFDAENAVNTQIKKGWTVLRMSSSDSRVFVLYDDGTSENKAASNEFVREEFRLNIPAYKGTRCWSCGQIIKGEEE
jgi:hypothetical protein